MIKADLTSCGGGFTVHHSLTFKPRFFKKQENKTERIWAPLCFVSAGAATPFMDSTVLVGTEGSWSATSFADFAGLVTSYDSKNDHPNETARAHHRASGRRQSPAVYTLDLNTAQGPVPLESFSPRPQPPPAGRAHPRYRLVVVVFVPGQGLPLVTLHRPGSFEGVLAPIE